MNSFTLFESWWLCTVLGGGGWGVEIFESPWHLVTALWRSALVSPIYCHSNSQQRRRWQFLRPCLSRLSLSLDLKNPLRKFTASMDIKNRHCFVRCSPRRWALFPASNSFEKKRWRSCSPHCRLSEQKGKRVTWLACHCWRPKGGCECGGRNPSSEKNWEISTCFLFLTSSSSWKVVIKSKLLFHEII